MILVTRMIRSQEETIIKSNQGPSVRTIPTR